ncbi:MAG: YIP1 family protein [Spirochaetaceae bacterium]
MNLSRHPLVRQLIFTVRLFRHPLDSMYELRYRQRGSVLSASLILLILYAVMVFDIGVTNFQFNLLGLRNTTPTQLVLYVFGPFFIWVTANYLVSSITHGQGRLQDVFVSAAYAMTPLIYLFPVIAVLSHALTLEEVAIYGFFRSVAVGWSAYLVFVHVMVVHQYDVGETVAVILWTFFTMAMMGLFGATLVMITIQSVNFLYEVFLEATLLI